MQDYGTAEGNVDNRLQFLEGLWVVYAVHKGWEAGGVGRVLEIRCSPGFSAFGAPQRWVAGEFKGDFGVGD